MFLAIQRQGEGTSSQTIILSRVRKCPITTFEVNAHPFRRTYSIGKERLVKGSLPTLPFIDNV